MTPTHIEWITKEEAGVRLGSAGRPLSPRRVLELAKGGRIESERVKDPRTNQMTVRIRAGSVERFLDERTTPPSERHQEIKNNILMHSEVREPLTPHALLELVRELREGCAARPASLWLTLQEAVEYSGLPAATLLEFIGLRRLPALDVGRRRGGRWRIRKIDLRKLEALPFKPSQELLPQA